MIESAAVSVTRYDALNSMDRLTCSFLEAREAALSKESGRAEADRPDLDPETQADAKGRLERLAAALAQLPPQCQQAFLLNRLEGLTHAEIAARLGVSTKTVQRNIERALQLCVQVLE